MQQHVLDSALARQVDGAFEVPHAVRVVERLVGVAIGQLPAELVDEEQSDDQQELPDQGRAGDDVRLVADGVRLAAGCVRLRFGRLGKGIHPPAPFHDDWVVR